MKLAIVIVLACATPVFAQNKQEAAAAYKQGQAQYMKEDYVAAASSFKAAYAADPDPVYLYNVAQAYRLGNKCLEAGEYYRRFLLEAKKPPNEEAVKTYIVEVDDCAKKAGQTPIDVQPRSVEPPQQQPPEEKPIDTTPIEPRDEGGGSNKRLFSYILGGVGVVGIGVGFFYMSKVGKQEDKAAAVCGDECSTWDPRYQGQLDDIEDKAKTYEALMVTGFVAGGAALTAGIVLFVMGGDSSKESPVTFTPTRGGATASYSLAF